MCPDILQFISCCVGLQMEMSRELNLVRGIFSHHYSCTVSHKEILKLLAGVKVHREASV